MLWEGLRHEKNDTQNESKCRDCGKNQACDEKDHGKEKDCGKDKENSPAKVNVEDV